MESSSTPDKGSGRLPDEREQGMLRSAICDFVGSVTGLRPPVESDQIPPEIKPHLDMLMFTMWNVARASIAEEIGDAHDSAQAYLRRALKAEAAPSTKECGPEQPVLLRMGNRQAVQRQAWRHQQDQRRRDLPACHSYEQTAMQSLDERNAGMLAKAQEVFVREQIKAWENKAREDADRNAYAPPCEIADFMALADAVYIVAWSRRRYKISREKRDASLPQKER